MSQETIISQGARLKSGVTVWVELMCFVEQFKVIRNICFEMIARWEKLVMFQN